MATRAGLLLEIRNIAPQPLMRRARGIYRVAAHHDVDVAALLKVRIEDHFAGRAPAWSAPLTPDRLGIRI